MNAAVLGGLVEQWVWRCQKLAMRYELRPAIDLQAEVEKLIGEAEPRAQELAASGPVFLATVANRLEMRAHIAELPVAMAPDELAGPALDAVGRAQALHALARAFHGAAGRLEAAA